jgi:acyl-CoA thioesterase-1
MLGLALALAGCGSGTPAPEPSETEAIGDVVPVMGPERRILAFGDSLFAGYGVKESESYPAKLEAALRARGVNARVANAGVSGDTSAAALQRLAFTLDNQAAAPDLAIVEFGGNDLLRNIAPAELRANLGAMLEELKRRNIPVLLMGMRAPPNLGADYQREFDAIYPELAKEYGAALVPFLLESIYDKPDLLQEDNIHPTAQGIEELVSATAAEVVEALPDEK